MGALTRDGSVPAEEQPDTWPGWGEYTEAIERHTELIGREAPPAAVKDSTGKYRLNPEFVSWMMCLPDGWVTDVPGLTRSQQLKALGNGVVPLQAEAALRDMLTTMRKDNL